MDELNKAIDGLIDDLFVDEVQAEETPVVEKSMIKDMKPQNETADEAVSSAPKGQKDESRGAGRPKQISDVPEKDEDGRRQSEYDSSITEDSKDGKTKEQDQVQPPKDMKKSETVEISKEDFEAFKAFKKSEAEKAEQETLQKARNEQSDLIKSAVIEATSSIREENEFLKKSLEEQGELIKSIANKPQSRKAVTQVSAVEKFEKSESASQGKSYSKQEVLDVAESLVKSKELTTEHVIELEQTGYIYDAAARGVLERKLKN